MSIIHFLNIMKLKKDQGHDRNFLKELDLMKNKDTKEELCYQRD